AVKGAMVLTGYKVGVIRPGSLLRDEVIKIKDSPDFKSYSSRLWGNMNDLTALKLSSNVYMAKIALAIGKESYTTPGQTLNVDPAAWNKIRNSFSEFGLGVRTGIDLPNEMAG
ncbi:MAG: penicillin-binding transpeptidase domain-containing protein, partial [Niallia sp.]